MPTHQEPLKDAGALSGVKTGVSPQSQAYILCNLNDECLRDCRVDCEVERKP